MELAPHSAPGRGEIECGHLLAHGRGPDDLAANFEGKVEVEGKVGVKGNVKVKGSVDIDGTDLMHPGRLRVNGEQVPGGPGPGVIPLAERPAPGMGEIECGHLLAHGRGPDDLAANFEGNIEVKGSITLDGDIQFTNGGADYAEALSTCDPAADIGLVVVVGEDGEIHLCTRDYDTSVAGVVSGAGGLRPAIVLDRHEQSVHVAMVGKVWCFADAGFGPIKPGDLLTTSSTLGHCRVATDTTRAIGAMIGKALTPLEHGKALIKVLVSSQ
jgi:hypothetical protein